MAYSRYANPFFIFSVLALANAFVGCKHDETGIAAPPDAAYYAGGATTVFDETSSAFEFPCSNLGAAVEAHAAGDRIFEATFVTAPAPINAGLGPAFNQSSCASCHGRNGRAGQPTNSEDLGGLLFRLSANEAGAHGAQMPLMGFGHQLQTSATVGKQPEGKVSVSYTAQLKTFLDGQAYTLNQPQYVFVNPYITMSAGFLYSPRIAPPVFGLGLLEGIPEADIRAHEDPYDANSDGISGRANTVWNEVTQRNELGRFGWKASVATLYQQVAAAFQGDMGLTTTVFPQEEFAGQPQDDGLSDDPEVSNDLLQSATFYVQSLAVPAARHLENEDVQAGKILFAKAQCGSCHIPQAKTGYNTALPFLSHQTFFPYTDLLLHDLGEALADHRPDFAATGVEWRTPPLWGIGLTQRTNGHTNFLHDGRANSILEAIMWHGGEAQHAQQTVASYSAKERAQLVKFLEAL